MLALNGTVKLTDFGLARARDRMYSLTAPGTVKGKLWYLAPEITLGHEAQPTSDMFSMGVVLWEALAGERLFDAAADVEVFRLIRECRIKPLAERRPDIPARLVAAIERALHRDPAERFASARHMAIELAGVLEASGMQNHHARLGQAVAAARKRLGVLGSLALTEPVYDPAELAVQSVEIEFSAVTREGDGKK
jgi:serine/threonine-protein kinase